MKETKIMRVFEQYIKKFDMNKGNVKAMYFHSIKMMELCKDIASNIGIFSEEEIVVCGLIGLFHDIGMFSNKFKIKLYDKLILMGTMFMTLVSIRHGMLLSLYALIIIGSSMGKYALNKEKDVIKRVEKWFDSKRGMAIMVIVVGIFSVLSYRGAPFKKFIND